MYSVRHIYQKFSSRGEVSKLGKREVLYIFVLNKIKNTALSPPHKEAEGKRRRKKGQTESEN